MDISEMTVEEFMKAEWDSDDSTEDKSEDAIDQQHSLAPEGAESSNKRRKKKKRIQDSIKSVDETEDGVATSSKGKSLSSHQEALNRLREKDPKFYEFLQQEDGSLLHFDDSKFNLSESSEDDDFEDDEMHKPLGKLEEASDSDLDHDDNLSDEEGNDSQKKKYPEKQRIVVTEEMIEGWKSKLIKPKSSLPALKDLMRAFHSAVARFSDDSDVKKKKGMPSLKFKVENSGTFNTVVGLCIRQVVPSLSKLLDYYPVKTAKKFVLPSRSKPWIKVKNLVKLYLSDVIALNKLLLEPSVLCATLRHTILLVPYFVCFPRNTKLLLKFLIKSWSSVEDESVRVLTFLCINRITKLDRNKYLEPSLRQCYLAYVANCKFTTPSILPMINFMQQTLCELFAVSPILTYQLSFLYIRQLAIHLRKAMTVTKKENYQAVYNWQYIHCLGLWCRMVGQLYSSDVIKPLLYPLVQVSLGTIDLVPTTRYFPLRYHVIRYLTTLSDATNTYIPLMPYITKPLKLAEFSKKKGGVITEPLKFSTILKLSNSQLKESSYRSSTMDEIYHAMMEYINAEAHTISFPEMVVPTMVFLKKYMKSCKMPNYIKLIRQIVEKVEESSKYIIERRSEVDFGVADVEAVAKWELEQKNHGVPFHKHYNHYKNLHQKERQHALADKDRNVEERLPTVDRRKFMALAKTKDKEEFGELFGQDDDDADGVEIDLEELVRKGKISRKGRKPDVIQHEIDDADDVDSGDADDVDSGDASDVDSGELLGEHQPEDMEELHCSKRKPENTMKLPVATKRSKIDQGDEQDVVEDFQFSSDDE